MVLMKIFIISSTDLGHRCLEEICKIPNVSIAGVLTTSKTFHISYAPNGVKNVLHRDFTQLTGQIGCELFFLEGKMSDPVLLAKVQAINFDCILVVGWHFLIPRSWLDRWPVFGIHASLLPKYAGGAPLVWALIAGEKKVGVTLFQMNTRVDAGRIVSQKGIRVRKRDDIGSLLAKVEFLSIRMLKYELPTLLSPSRVFIEQELSKGFVMRQRSPVDGEITELLSIKETRNFVRAQTRPYPGAFVLQNGDKITIWRLGGLRVSFCHAHDLVVFRGRHLYLAHKRKLLRITDYSIEKISESQSE